MKTEALTNQDWNDVVFENRNKDYGAYQLRKFYSERLMEGTFASVGIAFLLFFLPTIIGWFTSEQRIIRTICDEGGIILTPPPDFTPPANRPTHHQITNTELIPLVVSQEVVDLPAQPIDPLIEGPGDGSETGAVEFSGGQGAASGSVAGLAEAIPSGPLDFAEVMPEYEGGLRAMSKFIQKRLHYPNSARRMGLEGTVYVRFVVAADGSVKDVEVVRGIHADCDREAARVIALLSAWKPGMQNHLPVSVRMVLPIKFKFSD